MLHSTSRRSYRSSSRYLSGSVYISDPELTTFFAADRTPPAGRNINYFKDEALTERRPVARSPSISRTPTWGRRTSNGCAMR